MKRSPTSATGHSSIEIEEVSAAMVSRRKNTMAKICPSKPKLSNIKGNTVKTKVSELSKEPSCA
ncbi:Uncharacterised protein [Vibrio cholerae]|nr:Uncharacterised protein [Vibrio cholerae]CSC55906.1 Uncharacterised protein [Vibrio cholerae]